MKKLNRCGSTVDFIRIIFSDFTTIGVDSLFQDIITIARMLTKFISTDVLAVVCLEDYILAGIGCTLHVYSKFSGELKERIIATYPDKIHGIIKGPCNRIAVYGAKTLCTYDFIVHLDTIQITKISVTHRFMDWIIAVKWLQKNDVVSVLFAHNHLYVFNIFDKHYNDVQCAEKCILYGGSISGTCVDDLVIFSGTLFSETLIWTIKSTDKDNKNYASVLQRLKGHNGVISSVTYNALTKTICCTSDDRTITLWKVKRMSKEHFINWKSVEITLMATMYGHTGKVWRATVRDNIVVSIGQDSLICVWSTIGKLLNKIEAHPGSSIWSIDITEDNNTIVTGGGDGAINQWPVEYNNPEVDIVLQYNKTRIPKHVGFLNSNNILILVEGRMLLYRNKSDDCPKQSIDVPKYASYCVMQLSESRKFVALASKDGFLNIYKEIIQGDNVQLQEIIEEQVMDSKIFSMQWLNNNALLLCGVKGNLKIIDILSNETVSHRTDHILPPSRDCQVTAAVLYKSLMICGDRTGSIYVFQTFENVHNCTKTACHNAYRRGPVQIFPKIHGSLGVQSCTVTGTKLLSTGRDSTLRFYELPKSNDDVSLRVLCEKRMPMDWVSNTLKTDTDTIIFGFKEVEFIIYSIVLRRILFRISCGGGHRSWDCILANDCIKFIYIRDKQVYLVNHYFRSELLPVLQNGFHAKEVYSVQRLPTKSDLNIFISGGEDCRLRIFTVSESTSDNARCDLNTLDILDGHISNVKCIAVLNIENTNVYSRNLVFSGGGRAQLKVSEVTVRLDRKMLHSEDISYVQLTSHMLWGTDQQRKRSVKSQQYYIDPETRYMDISTYQDPMDKNQVFLFMACSDGYLRIFLYNIVTDVIALGTSIRYNRCILKVHSFTHQDKIIILTMATDGILNFSYLNPLLMDVVENIYKYHPVDDQSVIPFASFKLHQSGINSFDFKISTENVYLLTTGGDDNALNLIFVELFHLPSGELSAKIISKWNSSSMHSAQITGLKFHGTDKLFSSGIDQKVMSLVYSFDKEDLLVTEQNTMLTMIPDVQGLIVCNTDRNGHTPLCIYGKGFEMIADYSKV